MTTIVSIDTGDPEVAASTTAFVKVVFADDGTKERTAFTYSGSFTSQYKAIMGFLVGADRVVIEKIDSTNKFLSRSVIAEQLALMRFIADTCGYEVHELVRSGRKHVITDALMTQVQMWSEGRHAPFVHHHDVREATRNLLYFMAKDKELNPILSNHVRHFFKREEGDTAPPA